MGAAQTRPSRHDSDDKYMAGISIVTEMVVYLDNNATTIMPREVISEMVAWCNMGNPSSSYISAAKTREMMEQLRQLIGRCCGVTAVAAADMGSAAAATTGNFQVIFTSGASEANTMILTSVIASWQLRFPGRRPHIIISAIEHKSIIAATDDLAARGVISVSQIMPTPSGHITAAAVGRAIGPDTALVMVMHANNETGAINDAAAIGKIAHASNIPFYCDTVQAFGKLPLQPGEDIDGLCISFHKLHGPPGVGAIILRDEFVRGYGLHPLIYGTQNGGLRGGTENVPGLGAALRALQLSMTNREAKNTLMARRRDVLLRGLAGLAPVISYSDYMAVARQQASIIRPIIVILGGLTKSADSLYLPNTILMSVVRWAEPSICNAKFKERLAAAGVIVSIGSACNTSSSKASHVLDAMAADKYIKAGALRISLGDDTTDGDITTFLREFAAIFAEL